MEQGGTLQPLLQTMTKGAVWSFAHAIDEPVASPLTRATTRRLIVGRRKNSVYISWGTVRKELKRQVRWCVGFSESRETLQFALEHAQKHRPSSRPQLAPRDSFVADESGAHLSDSTTSLHGHAQTMTAWRDKTP